jgi:hypothetical protein
MRINRAITGDGDTSWTITRGRWPMTDTTDSTDTPPRRRRTDRSPWYLLLLVPIVLLVYPPMYNRQDPELGGLPFFYWYQLAVVPVGVACTVVAYLKTRSNGDRR